MIHIIIVTLSFLLIGCQIRPSPPILTSANLSGFSNEDLCRAFGTYSHDGKLVLNIYEELKTRSEKIDPEKCFALEMMSRNSTDNTLKKYNNFNNGRITPLYMNSHRYESLESHSQTSSNDMNQNIDPQHHKMITNPRKNNKPDTETLDLIKLNASTYEYKARPNARDSFYLNTKDTVTDKIDITEKEMDELMKRCLRKHISR